MKNRAIIIIAAGLMSMSVAVAQQESWTLDQCIDYAQKNSLSVEQRQLMTEKQELQLNTTKNSRLPSLGASLGSNLNFGRAQSRDGIYTDNTQLSGSASISTSVDLFNGLRIRNEIKGGEFNLAAAMYDLDKAREDVALNVTALYLQVLYYREMKDVATRQLTLSSQLQERSLALFESGKMPESAVYESEALKAADQASLVQADNNYSLALLELSQALNRESAEGFSIRIPQLDNITLNNMGQLPSPNAVYDYSEVNRPSIKAENLRLLGSQSNVRVAKSALYPRVSMSAGYGNNVYHSYMTGAQNKNFWDQLSRNGSDHIGLSVNIPIFNRFASRNQIRNANIAVRSQQLAVTEAQLNLRKEIERSYTNASAAYAKLGSSENAAASARKAFEYESEKSKVGRSTIFDYNDAKTRLEKAEAEVAQSKYEFIFRRKILDFYGGQPLTFDRY